MKVWIDQDLCTGDGLCEEIAPVVFTLLDDGLAYVKEGDKVFSDPGGAEGLANVPAGMEEAHRVGRGVPRRVHLHRGRLTVVRSTVHARVTHPPRHSTRSYSARASLRAVCAPLGRARAHVVIDGSSLEAGPVPVRRTARCRRAPGCEDGVELGVG